jgi:hypothetical protein
MAECNEQEAFNAWDFGDGDPIVTCIVVSKRIIKKKSFRQRFL